MPTGGVVGELSTVVVVEGERTGGEWGVVHRGTEVVGWIGGSTYPKGFRGRRLELDVEVVEGGVGEDALTKPKPDLDDVRTERPDILVRGTRVVPIEYELEYSDSDVFGGCCLPVLGRETTS